jgi:hypothetical protein
MVLVAVRQVSMGVVRPIRVETAVPPGTMDGGATGPMPGLAMARRQMRTATTVQGGTITRISSFGAIGGGRTELVVKEA